MFDKLQKTHYAAIGVGTAVVIGLAAWLLPDPDTENLSPEVTTQPTASGAQSPWGAASAAMPTSASMDPMSPKFDASRLFEIGYAGGLKIDSETQRKLDEVLASMGDDPTEADMAKLERTLREGLPREDAEKALKLVKGYRGYVGEVKKDFEAHGVPMDRTSVDAMFQRMEANQRQHFDNDTAQALFGQQLKEGRIVMEAALVEQDRNLSWEEKKERLDALRKQLPPEKANSIVEPAKPEGTAASTPQ